MATKVKKFLTAFDEYDLKGQTFDQKATFRMKGKDIIIKDYVQENAIGTDFYKNLEIYGNAETTAKAMSVYREELIGDFSEATSLIDLENRRNKLKIIWDNLPAEIRSKEFKNKFQNFMNDGAKFVEHQASILEMENLRRQQNVTQSTTEITDNNTVQNQQTNQAQGTTEQS